LHTRSQLVLIAGRRGRDNEPLLPSRLLLAGADRDLPVTVLDFYRSTHTDPPRLEIARSSAFALPPPWQAPIDRLPVTALRDYLRCPYRFFLRHVVGLAAMSEPPREMSPAVFGSLAHAVLSEFARSRLADSADAGLLAAHLSRLLDELFVARFGRRPTPAALVQREHLRRRLESFARWQAGQVTLGWTIDSRWIENELRATLDGVTLVGRLDRVDRHPEHGCRLVDYKTRDEPQTPEAAHRGASGWRDLQLPLYAFLARENGLLPPADGPAPRLAFLQLHRRGEVAYLEAEWSAEVLTAALEEARRVIEAIRAGIFWPPSPEAPAGDAFDWVSTLARQRAALTAPLAR
jgi:RecB family exonuclease